MSERLISKNRRGAARGAAGDLLASDIARLLDLFSDDERLERLGEGKDHYLGGIVSHRSKGQARQPRAVIDLVFEEGVVGRRKRHQDNFELDAFVLVETSVIGGVNRQKANAG